MRRFLITAALAAFPLGQAHAGSEQPTVVELFTSQSCSSCPPAEAFLGELAGRPDVIALEFHVDYWDDLVHGGAGKWKDPFSHPAFTARQRAYNVVLRHRPQVYTPQMVIAGRDEAVGSDRPAVLAAIERAAAAGRGLALGISRLAQGGLSVSVEGNGDGPAAVWLARVERVSATRVTGGENKGLTLTNHRVVRELRRIGDWAGAPVALEVPELELASNESCIAFVQDERQGPILAAATCP